MKEKIKVGIIIMIIICMLVGYFINISSNNKNIMKGNKKINYNVDIEKYILGVVACEMPALYHEEALKAQNIKN